MLKAYALWLHSCGVVCSQCRHSSVKAYALLLVYNGIMLMAHALLFPYLEFWRGLTPWWYHMHLVVVGCITLHHLDLMMCYMNEEYVVKHCVNYVFCELCDCVSYYSLAYDIHRIFIECNSHPSLLLCLCSSGSTDN